MMPKPTPTESPTLRPLVKLRIRAGLSLKDVATTCRVSNSTPMRWEAGIIEPRPPQREAYAKALGITVEKLGAIIYANRVQA